MPKPVLQALVMADQIYQDKDTGKMVIAGTFTGVGVLIGKQKREQVDHQAEQEKQFKEQAGTIGSFPLIGKAGSPYVYICLTDIRDTTELELRYVDLRDNKALFKAKLNVQCKDPLHAVELKVALPSLPMPHWGMYSLELLCEDELLGSWRVSVEEVDATAKEE